jgi:hypothetical protein
MAPLAPLSRSSSKTATFVALLLSILHTSNAQIGVTICACQPASYTFRFNFTNSCENTTTIFPDQPGVVDVGCVESPIISGDDDGLFDLVPVQITTVEVLELDQFQVPIGGKLYKEGYTNGDEITYVSIAGTSAGIFNLTELTVPKGLQLNIAGRNKFDLDITNFWIILFSNDCGLFPVLHEGDKIGWTDMVRLKKELTFWSLKDVF